MLDTSKGDWGATIHVCVRYLWFLNTHQLVASRQYYTALQQLGANKVTLTFHRLDVST